MGRVYYLRVWRSWACLLVAVVCVACEKKDPTDPSPGNGGSGETISGRERLGWDQPAVSTGDLATYRYAIYVDGVRSEMTDISCGSAAGANGYACSGRLPSMSPGAHTLQLATFNGAGESSRSASLQVTVTGASAPAEPDALRPGDTVATQDGIRLQAQLVAENLDEPTDVAVAPDGRLFIAQRSGVLILDGSDVRNAGPGGEAGERVLSIALHPDFAQTRHVFLTEAIVENGARVFRTSRFRDFGGRLVERMVLLPEIAASGEPSAALRFGHDGKLYAAFDDGGSAESARRLSEWSGKVLRLEPDGRTPADQPSASPVFVSALKSPRGLAWTPDGETMWLAETGVDGIERLRAVATSGERPRRAGQRASYALPERVGLGPMAIHSGAAAPPFKDDLFIAARDGGYLLRVRFEQEDRRRVVTTERFLEGQVGPVHAVTVAPDGSLVVATASQVWRLAPVR